MTHFHAPANLSSMATFHDLRIVHMLCTNFIGQAANMCNKSFDGHKGC